MNKVRQPLFEENPEAKSRNIYKMLLILGFLIIIWGTYQILVLHKTVAYAYKHDLGLIMGFIAGWLVHSIWTLKRPALTSLSFLALGIIAKIVLPEAWRFVSEIFIMFGTIIYIGFWYSKRISGKTA